MVNLCDVWRLGSLPHRAAGTCQPHRKSSHQGYDAKDNRVKRHGCQHRVTAPPVHGCAKMVSGDGPHGDIPLQYNNTAEAEKFHVADALFPQRRIPPRLFRRKRP
jgi:hypothetical protein